MSGGKRNTGLGVMLLTIIGMTGCAHPQWGMWGCGPCAPACNTCNTCETGCNTCETSCDPCGSSCNTCQPKCGGILPCGGGGQFMADVEFFLFGWACKKSNAVPETLPLGSTVRSHYQVMESNAEAADFILHRHDFVGQTAVLTSDGKDKVLEIAARMPSTPFPVVVERSENNSNPELDAMRRNLVARVVTDLGNQDGQQRTVVSTPYGPGYTGRRAEQMYYQHVYRGGNNQNNQNGGGGFGGGAGGGGGGGGFGGGF